MLHAIPSSDLHISLHLSSLSGHPSSSFFVKIPKKSPWWSPSPPPRRRWSIRRFRGDWTARPWPRGHGSMVSLPRNMGSSWNLENLMKSDGTEFESLEILIEIWKIPGRERRAEHRTRNGTGTERKRNENGTRTREMLLQHLRHSRFPSAFLAAGKTQLSLHKDHLLHVDAPSAFGAACKMHPRFLRLVT